MGDETSPDDPAHEDSNKKLIMKERDLLVKDFLNCEDGDLVMISINTLRSTQKNLVGIFPMPEAKIICTRHSYLL